MSQEDQIGSDILVATMGTPCSLRIILVVACQRYVCPSVISMTMNVIIQECIIENCFIEPYV